MQFALCEEIDIWVEVKPQAMVGGTTIRFNSLGDGTYFYVPSQIRLTQECNYTKLVQVE